MTLIGVKISIMNRKGSATGTPPIGGVVRADSNTVMADSNQVTADGGSI